MRRLSIVSLAAIFFIGAQLKAEELASPADDSSPGHQKHGLTETEQREADDRMAFMLKHAKGYVGKCDGTNQTIKPLPKALLRWQNLHNSTMDGILAGWVDEDGRPRAIAQIFWVPNTPGKYAVEFQSFWEGPMKFESDDDPTWKPQTPGLEWKEFPGNPKPVASKRLRLSQMRKLARGFRGDDRFYRQNNTLRLMPSPMIRYAVPKDGLIDGAVFAMCLGTDPEMLVAIEAWQKKGSEGGVYRWAFAPMTSWPLKGYLNGKQVYTKPGVRNNQPENIFFMCDLKGSPDYVGTEGVQ